MMPSPTILALDGSSERAVSLALWHQGALVAQEYSFSVSMKSAWLITHLPRVMIATPHIILVTRGPGSFTSLRAFVTFAHGLALAWNSQLYGITSLEAEALCALQDKPHGYCHTVTLPVASRMFVQNFVALSHEPFYQATDDITSQAGDTAHHHTFASHSRASVMVQWWARLTAIPPLPHNEAVTPLYLKDHYAHSAAARS